MEFSLISLILAVVVSILMFFTWRDNKKHPIYWEGYVADALRKQYKWLMRLGFVFLGLYGFLVVAKFVIVYMYNLSVSFGG